MAFLIEKIELGNFPTPAHRLDRISDLLKSEIWIKRDDLSGKIYGGNKVRKLEYLLADAKRKKSETVITFGGLGSHHCVAVAAYASLVGMEVVVILFDQPLTPYVRESLLLDHTFGAEMKYAGSYLKAFYLGIREYVKRRKSYLILPGGSNPLSTLGYMDAVKELKKTDRQRRNSTTTIHLRSCRLRWDNCRTDCRSIRN
jgi:1-aminocyclopropane-1-carboxylate deaminase/D-cysteine desulfhydrase-like pyridoxal-dependent ACC family enzyme